MISGFLTDDVLTRVQQLQPIADDLRPVDGPARRRLGAAEPQRLLGASSAPRVPSRSPTTSQAAGVRLSDEVLQRIDDVLGDVVERDPSKTDSPQRRP